MGQSFAAGSGLGQVWAFLEGVNAGCGHWRAKQFRGVAAGEAAAALPVGGFPGQKCPDQKCPDQTIPWSDNTLISFVSVSSLPNLGCSSQGKLPGKGFLHGKKQPNHLKLIEVNGNSGCREEEGREVGVVGIVCKLCSCTHRIRNWILSLG